MYNDAMYYFILLYCIRTLVIFFYVYYMYVWFYECFVRNDEKYNGEINQHRITPIFYVTAYIEYATH